DEIDIGSILTKIAIGTGIIIVSATIIAVTGGGATPIACFFATTATLSAVSIAGGVIAAGIDFAMGGSMQKVADSFANGFLFTAVLSSAVTLTTGVGAACFAENTPVQTQNGAVPIQHVKPFDFVLSYNHQTQLTEYKRVVKTYAKEVGETVTIIAGEEKIVTTLEHPFFANGAYVAAKDLKAGDKLKNSDNKYVKVKNVKINKLKDKITVYNFDVEDNQNYFAGGVLVHNVCNGAQSLGGIGGAGAVPGGYSLKNVAMLFGKITLGVVSAGTLLSFNFKRVGDPIDYGRGYIPVGDLFISRFWVYTKDHFGSVYDKTGLKKVYRMAYIDQNNILQVVGRWIVPRTNPNDIYIPRVGVWGYALNANQALTILWLGGVYNRTVAPHITDANYTVDGVENFDQIVLDNYYDPMVQEVFKIFVHNIPSAKAVGVYAYDPHDAMYLAMRAGLTPSVTGPTWYDQWDTWLAGGTMVESYFISGYEQAGHFHFVDPTKSIYLWYMDPYYTAFYANKNGLQYRRNNPWTKHAFE
ncbi:MAG: HINT domain-containing protein, partial [Firmicutes bacterium]|nr:HINT domain-containing protein [Bacillota bacterium]